MSSIDFKFLVEPPPMIDADAVDVIQCIREFDHGFEAVYIADERGKYKGQAITRKGFHAVFDTNANAISNIPSIPYEYLVRGNNGGITQYLSKLVANYPDAAEFPVISNGNFVGRVVKNYHPVAIFPSKVPLGIPTDFYEYKAIYLSSLENENLRFFYNRFKPLLPLIPLSNDNICQAVKSENNLLVYGVDVFPACNKISIDEIYRKFSMTVKRDLAKKTFFTKDYAHVSLKESYQLDCLIAIFDEGYDAIIIEDNNEEFSSVILPSDLRNDFPSKYIKRRNDYLIQTKNDEAELRQMVAEWFYGTDRREVPILDGKKVIVSAVLGDSWVRNIRPKTLRNIQPLRWEYISDEVAQDFFAGNRRVLISSNQGNLLGFYERFSSLLEITVFSDEILDQYLSDNFDMLIFGMPVWDNGATTTLKYEINMLYARLLIEEVSRRFKKNKINYHIIDFHNKAANMDCRHARAKSIALPSVMETGKRGTYFVFSDMHLDDKVNFFGGRRRTVGNPDVYRNTIYFFGACIAFGFYASDGNTIASFLQKQINDDNSDIRVVNCGSPNLNFFNNYSEVINSLYRIVDMEFKKGDILIHFMHEFPQCMGGLSTFSDNSCHEVRYPFNTVENLRKKVFPDGLMAHLTIEGYKIMADYIYKIIRQDMQREYRDIATYMLFPEFERMDRTIFSEGLAAYFSQVAEFKVNYNNIGAIVMNCNPFTRGHDYLVEQARKYVDFLYVFVVEEDSSEFTFNDRFNMAKVNCTKYNNICVLPSGKYMISRETFDEYFNKDSLQDQEINPVKDVNIFGRYIAPFFNITKRFVGEEPIDLVTRQYNVAMEEILPRYGVELLEIPRLTDKNGDIVNATTVRKLLQTGRLDDCQNWLTYETLCYIKRNEKRVRMILKERTVIT